MVLTQDSPDLSGISPGETITLVGRTDGIRGTRIFEITSVLPGPYIVRVTPTPTTTDNQTEWYIGGAFFKIGVAAEVVEAGDVVNIQEASGDYVEAVSVPSGGTGSNTDKVLLRGYRDTPGDGVQIRWRCPAGGDCLTLQSGVRFWVIQDVWFRQTSLSGNGRGIAGANADNVTLRNVRSSGHQGAGIRLGNNCALDRVYAHDNGGDGIRTGSNTFVINCASLYNGGAGVELGSGTTLFALCVGNSGQGVDFTGTGFQSVVHCTVHGKELATGHGIRFPAGNGGYPAIVVNCIVVECGVGIKGPSTSDSPVIGEGVILFGNTTNYEDFETQLREVLEDPLFLDPDNGDYSLTRRSPAIAGVTVSDIEGLEFSSNSSYAGSLAKLDTDFFPLYPWYIP